jgi:hypothetical protein
MIRKNGVLPAKSASRFQRRNGMLIQEPLALLEVLVVSQCLATGREQPTPTYARISTASSSPTMALASPTPHGRCAADARETPRAGMGEYHLAWQHRWDAVASRHRKGPGSTSPADTPACHRIPREACAWLVSLFCFFLAFSHIRFRISPQERYLLRDAASNMCYTA